MVCLCRRRLPSMILSQLVYLALVKPDINIPADAAPTSKKQEKKLMQQLKRLAAGREKHGLAWAPVSDNLLYSLEFSDDFDTLVLAGVIILLNVVSAVVLKWFFIPTYPFSIVIVTILGYGIITMFLAKVEWSHAVVTRNEKIAMFIAGILGAFVAFSLLMYAPPNTLPFNTAAASKEWFTLWDKAVGHRFNTRLNATAAAMGLNITSQPVVQADNPFSIAAPLALVAGMLNALLLSPGLRYGRVLQQLLKPPLWARNFGASNMLMRTVARTGFALQVLIVPLWITPLTDVFQLPEPTLRYIRGVTLLVAALLQGVMIPTLVQSFLFTAAYQIHILTRTPELPEEVSSKLIRQTANLTVVQTCKAAMQLSFVPMLMMLCAFLYILTAFPSPKSVTHKYTWGSTEPAALYPSCTGFIGWWGSCAYIGWASLGVLMARLARTTDT
eukprot:GHUV01019900.1.p1 GENE.GHUV01019900.1~~GHUV01019900.1.p1  ORF type:complete len:443 (+),score=85.54 GHUV01019900.1:505-1833(+)